MPEAQRASSLPSAPRDQGAAPLRSLIRVAESAAAASPKRSTLAVGVSALYFAVYLHYGVYTTFLPLWLEARGLGPGEIGTLLAIPLFLRLVVAAPVANLADRLRRIREVLFVCLALAVAGMAGMVFLTDFWAFAVLLTAIALAWDPAPVLTDGYAAAAVRTASLDFGRLRLWGSLAFVVASLSAGQLIGWSGIGVVPLLLAGALAVPLLVLPLLTPDRHFGSGVVARSGEWRALLRDRQLMLVMAGGALIVASHAIVNSFGAIQWAGQGIGVVSIGLLTSIAMGAEVVVLWFAQSLLRGRAPHWLVLVGGLAAALRWLAMFAEPGFVPLVALQLLNGVSAMATIVGVMLTIAARTPAHLMATANGLNTVLIGLGQALVTLLAGQLWGLLGPLAYLIMAATAGLACVVVAIGTLRAAGVPAD